MRFMVTVSFSTEKTNEMARAGTMDPTIVSILEELKPEAAYFTTVDGKRGGILIVHMDDASQLMAVAEPFFLAFDATIEVEPVMVVEDFEKGAAGLEAAVKKYG